jgi:uncharacterized ion transporter superfamily protein YfcC
MEETILSRINNVANEPYVGEIEIMFKGAEIVCLAKYIELLEEKEMILNALLGKGTNVVVNVQNGKE